jgi:hypothetical protein
LGLLGITAALLAFLMALPILRELPADAGAPSNYLLSRWAIRLSGAVLVAIGALTGARRAPAPERMTGCAAPTNAVTPCSPATSGT